MNFQNLAEIGLVFGGPNCWLINRALVGRDGLKDGPVLLSNSQASPGRNFSQTSAHLLVHLCTYIYKLDQSNAIRHSLCQHVLIDQR